MVATYYCIDLRAEKTTTGESDLKPLTWTPWWCWFSVWCSECSRLKFPFLHTEHLFCPPKIITWNNSKSEFIDLLENPFWRLINCTFEELPNGLLILYCKFSSHCSVTQLKVLSQDKLFCFLKALFFSLVFFPFAPFWCHFSLC